MVGTPQSGSYRCDAAIHAANARQGSLDGQSLIRGQIKWFAGGTAKTAGPPHSPPVSEASSPVYTVGIPPQPRCFPVGEPLSSLSSLP
jgi:hypothetical protein